MIGLQLVSTSTLLRAYVSVNGLIEQEKSYRWRLSGSFPKNQ